MDSVAAAILGVQGTIQIVNWGIELDQCPSHVRRCLELVHTCHADLQALIEFRSEYLSLLKNRHLILERVNTVIVNAYNGLKEVCAIIEKCRPDAEGGRTGLRNRVGWVMMDSSEFKSLEPLISRQHASVLSELNFLRSIALIAPLREDMDARMPSRAMAGTTERSRFENKDLLTQLFGAKTSALSTPYVRGTSFPAQQNIDMNEHRTGLQYMHPAIDAPPPYPGTMPSRPTSLQNSYISSSASSQPSLSLVPSRPNSMSTCGSTKPKTTFDKAGIALMFGDTNLSLNTPPPTVTVGLGSERLTPHLNQVGVPQLAAGQQTYDANNVQNHASTFQSQTSLALGGLNISAVPTGLDSHLSQATECNPASNIWENPKPMQWTGAVAGNPPEAAGTTTDNIATNLDALDLASGDISKGNAVSKLSSAPLRPKLFGGKKRASQPSILAPLAPLDGNSQTVQPLQAPANQAEHAPLVATQALSTIPQELIYPQPGVSQATIAPLTSTESASRNYQTQPWSSSSAVTDQPNVNGQIFLRGNEVLPYSSIHTGSASGQFHLNHSHTTAATLQQAPQAPIQEPSHELPMQNASFHSSHYAVQRPSQSSLSYQPSQQSRGLGPAPDNPPPSPAHFHLVGRATTMPVMPRPATTGARIVPNGEEEDPQRSPFLQQHSATGTGNLGMDHTRALEMSASQVVVPQAPFSQAFVSQAPVAKTPVLQASTTSCWDEEWFSPGPFPSFLPGPLPTPRLPPSPKTQAINLQPQELSSVVFETDPVELA
jgi:hypothetical protein